MELKKPLKWTTPIEFEEDTGWEYFYNYIHSPFYINYFKQTNNNNNILERYYVFHAYFLKLFNEFEGNNIVIFLFL